MCVGVLGNAVNVMVTEELNHQSCKLWSLPVSLLEGIANLSIGEQPPCYSCDSPAPANALSILLDSNSSCRLYRPSPGLHASVLWYSLAPLPDQRVLECSQLKVELTSKLSDLLRKLNCVFTEASAPVIVSIFSPDKRSKRANDGQSDD